MYGFRDSSELLDRVFVVGFALFAAAGCPDQEIRGSGGPLPLFARNQARRCFRVGSRNPMPVGTARLAHYLQA